MNNEASYRSQGIQPSEIDIPTLIQRAQNGDSQAVSALYSLHYQKVYTFAYYRLGGNVHLAEDIAEETLIRAFRVIGTFKWKGISFSAWLTTIARNLIIDLLRRPEPLPLEETWVDAALDPAKIVEQSLVNAEMLHAIEKLTPEQKDVIILRFFEDFSLEETAKITEKTIAAVKRLQARALAALEGNLLKE